MAYLNDTEKRLLLSALHREKGICKVIDEQKSDGILLAPFVESLERKLYYDRFEKEIRAKAIDDVFDYLKTQRKGIYMRIDFDDLEIKQYKEQLKAGGK